MERRRESRLFIEAPGHYRRRGEGPRPMHFSQISVNGCRITERDCPLEVGERIEVMLGQVDGVDGEVRWRLDDHAGILFAAPLDQPIVEFFAAYCG